MAQFIIYKDNDASAPVLNGNTGSLLNVLDKCLVDGYGSKPGAGWSRTLPITASYGCFTQPVGSSGLCLFVDDMGSGSASGSEARLTGWSSITSIEAGIVTGSNQFPLVTQQKIASGSVIARKSTVPTSTNRNWIIMADSHSMYGFVLPGDTAGVYTSFMFGDFYSIKSGSVDTQRCMIAGRSAPSSSAATIDKLDILSSSLNTPLPGNFIAGPFGGGTSISCSKHGDAVKGTATQLRGNVPYFNSVDNGLYISPVWVVETATSLIRGRMRGFYQFCHVGSNVVDGQTFNSSSSDFPGKTFMVISGSGNTGVYFMETSNTLETN